MFTGRESIPKHAGLDKPLPDRGTGEIPQLMNRGENQRQLGISHRDQDFRGDFAQQRIG